MNKTNIQYLTHTWNPIAMRCDKISPACDNCWHLRTADRLSNNPKIPAEIRASYRGELQPTLKKYELDTPLKLKHPSIIGVQFMGDLFHDKIKFNIIDEIFYKIDLCCEHTFLILTKRIKRVLEYHAHLKFLSTWDWPKNLWLGATVEDQQRADERISILLSIPAAVHFVSFEPLLTPVDVRKYLGSIVHADDIDGLGYGDYGPWHDGISWSIVGAETGPGARPMNPAWARSLRDQCRSSKTPFFMKQMSGKEPIPDDLMIREFPK